MQPVIRDAEASDIAAITAIYTDCVENGTASYELSAPDEAEMLRRFEAIRRRGCPYIVALGDDGAIDGYAYASAFRDRPAYNWLLEDSIYLSRNARGKGLGRVLLAELLERSETLGFRQMVAVIGDGDKASVGLHRAAGFDMIGRMPATGFKFGRWLDTVIMQKPLGSGATAPGDRDVYPGTIRPKA